MRQSHILRLLLTIRAVLLDVARTIEIYLQNYVARVQTNPFDSTPDKILQEQIENVIAQNIYPRIIINRGTLTVIESPIDLNGFRPQFPQLISHYYAAIESNENWAIIPMEEPVPWVNPLLQSVNVSWQRPESQPRISADTSTFLDFDTPDRFKKFFNIQTTTYMKPGFGMKDNPVKDAEKGTTTPIFPENTASSLSSVVIESSYPKPRRTKPNIHESGIVTTEEAREVFPDLFDTQIETRPAKRVSKSLLRPTSE